MHSFVAVNGETENGQRRTLQLNILLLNPARIWEACYFQDKNEQQSIESVQAMEDVDLFYSNDTKRIMTTCDNG